MRLNKLWLGLAGGGILLVGLITGALMGGGLPALAANALTGQASGPAASTPAASTNYCQDYLNALASQLGKSVSAVEAANQAALTSTIQQAYKDGKISQAEETKLLNQVKSDSTQPCAFGRLGRGLSGNATGSGGKLQAARSAILAAVAQKLGLNSTTLESELRSGQSISQIAQNQHVALTGSNGLNAAYLSVVQQQLNQAVASKLITQATSTKLYQMAQQGVSSGHYFLLDGSAHESGRGGHKANPSQTPTTQS